MDCARFKFWKWIEIESSELRRGVNPLFPNIMNYMFFTHFFFPAGNLEYMKQF